MFKQLEGRLVNFTREQRSGGSGLVFEKQLVREEGLEGLLAVQFSFWGANPACYSNSSAYHSAQFGALQVSMHDMSDAAVFKDLWLEVWFSAREID